MTTVPKIQWAWGQKQAINFDPTSDVLDFGWAFQAGQLLLIESKGSAVLVIFSNSQSYILVGATLDELSAANFRSNDIEVTACLTSVLDANHAAKISVVGVGNDPALYY